MFLEIATLAVLTLVLMVKFGTSSHTSKLQQACSDLELRCRRYEHQYTVLCESKDSIQSQQGELEKQRCEVERELNEVRAALDDQNTRNRTLEERIEQLVS